MNNMSTEQKYCLYELFSKKQIEVMEEIGVDLLSLREMKGRKIHQFMVSNNAFTDGVYLIFSDDNRGGDWSAQQRYLYYIGAEREAEVEARFRGITIYSNVDNSRFRYAEKVTIIGDEVEEKEDEDDFEDE